MKIGIIGSGHIGGALTRRPAGTVGRIGPAVAGDHPNAKATGMYLINDIGSDSVESGTIEDSWRQQPGTYASLHRYSKVCCGHDRPAT